MIGLPILKVRPVESKQPHTIKDDGNSKFQSPNSQRNCRVWILESEELPVIPHRSLDTPLRFPFTDIGTLVILLFSLC